MKTITLIGIAAEAINTVTTAVNMVLGVAKDDPEVDKLAAALSGDRYMILSESMTVVRELLKEFPEEIMGEELNDARSNFYMHLFSQDDLYDLNKLHSACHQMHGDIYKIYNTAREAIRLYT